MSFEVIDIIFAVLILIITIRSFLRGLIEEMMSMAAVVLGLAASFFFHKNGGMFLAEKFMPGSAILPDVLAFVMIFLIVFMALKLQYCKIYFRGRYLLLLVLYQRGLPAP